MRGRVERGTIKDNPAFPPTLHYRNTFPNRTRTRKVCSKIQYHFLKGLLVGYDVTHISPSLSAVKPPTGLSSERSAAARRVGCIRITFAIPQPVIFTTWRKREGKQYCPVLAQVKVFRYRRIRKVFQVCSSFKQGNYDIARRLFLSERVHRELSFLVLQT
jgi:hypothetical protein